jgi:hypothetical protein
VADSFGVDRSGDDFECVVCQRTREEFEREGAKQVADGGIKRYSGSWGLPRKDGTEVQVCDLCCAFAGMLSRVFQREQHRG